MAELRGRVFKHSRPGGREVGNWLAVKWGRPSAVYGTWVAVRLGLSANVVTALALGSQVMVAVAVGSGGRWGFVLGVGLAHLAYWLDHVDGQVARWRGTASLSGVYFDYLLHHVAAMTLGFGLGSGLAMRGGAPLWAVGGFVLALGWTWLGLDNDCRYKAFFQRLKAEPGRYLVVGGSGGRPMPPPGWPARWPGVVSWPLAKLNEPHVVLLTLSLLGVLAVVRPEWWEAGWRGYVLGLGPVSVLLALGRSARAVAFGKVDEEFHRWFRPVAEMERRETSDGPRDREVGAPMDSGGEPASGGVRSVENGDRHLEGSEPVPFSASALRIRGRTREVCVEALRLGAGNCYDLKGGPAKPALAPIPTQIREARPPEAEARP